MDKTFNISVRDRLAKNLSHLDYVCGNTGYMVRFDFDEEWDAYPIKTARFIESSGEHHDVAVIDNQCEFPQIMNTIRVEVGVYAGDLYTTTPAVIGARRSILSTGGDRPAVPEEIEYDKMMEAINQDALRAENAAGEAETAAEEAKKAAEKAVGGGIVVVQITRENGVMKSSHTFRELQDLREKKVLLAMEGARTYTYFGQEGMNLVFANVDYSGGQNNKSLHARRLVISSDDTVAVYSHNNVKVPNPNRLKITGAVSAEYDGSSPVTVNIPEGGEGSGTGLPTGGEPHQMLVTDAEGKAKWEERTHYVENGTVDYLPECEGTLIDAEGMFIITEPFKHDFVFGETYTVYWNGVAYETVCKEFVEDEGDPPAPGFGDMDLLMGTGSTGEPFFIAVTPNGVEGNTEITAMLVALDGSTSVTLKIEGEGEVVHKIPDKFINFPESDVMIVDCTSETSLDFTTLKPNKTFAQVEEAYNSGKHVIFRIDGFLDVPVIGVAGDQISGRIFSNTQIESFWMTRNEEYLTHDVSHINREVGLVYMSVSKTGGIQTGTIFSSVEGLREICKTVVCIFSDAREGIECELPLLSYNQTAKTAVFGLASNERFIKVTILASSRSFEYIPMGVNLEGYATEEYVNEKTKKLSEDIANKLGFDPAKQGLPIMYMWGDTTGESKDDEVTLTYQFGEHSGTLTRKWQGSGSIGLGQELGAILGDPNDGKMNYTIKLDKAFEAKEGWGEQKKYCLKANVADFSHARNLIATRLWGQARANSASPSPMLYKCPNWGAVDGFPVLLIVNDEYRGLYTMNIPKDGWMLNMPHEGATREAIVCAEVGANFTGSVTIGNGKTYEIEYVTDENDAGWVQESLQALWDAVKNMNSQEVRARLDIESAIDYLLMVAKCTGGDALARNYLLHTTDGIKWAFTVYDADTWFGINWGGVGHLADDGLPTVYDCAEANALMMYLVKYIPDKIVARYNELRETVLSAKNIVDMVLDFEAQIPKAVFDAEVVRWPGISTTATNNSAQIIDHVRAREPLIDEEVTRLDAPTLPAKAGWYDVDASGAAMNTITDINFDPDYVVTGDEEASWDCSLNKDGGIMAYRTGTVVTIKPTTHKFVKLPVDASYMFANDGTNASFSELARITGTEIFTCQPKASMAYMCINCNKLKTPVYIPHGVINCNSMYVNTWSLKSPSVIPIGVLYMSGMYNGGSLNTLPQIPDSVTEMNDAFVGNVYATNLPRVIPAGVITIQNAFKTCRAASGMIEIKAKNIINYTNAFLDACVNSDGIVLVGPNTQLAEIAATNAEGKVTVG